ncbi:diguanylate cyclase [Ketobacter alkanivorans]|uniref:diguanylate cyclase n=1 Tax=Ketobacter alkanivorans TaxID=1917421 RepID=A0A2K9LQK2_9GAMM|nr:diguanylate cyclase [Ketobacter alkanivorans]AUM14411.1 hypothetical protein Kalk_19135 [Ketobacter alkanivorans]
MMYLILRPVVLGVMFLLLPCIAMAGQATEFRVWPSHGVLLDTTGELSVHDILSEKAEWATMQNTHSAQHGYQTQPAWFRFTISASTDKPEQMYLELGTPFLDYVDFYFVQVTPQGKNILMHSVAGDQQTFLSNVFGHRFPVFPFEVAQTGDYQVYLRVQSSSALIFPMNFHVTNGFFAEEFKAQAFYGLFFGMMAVLAFYNGYVWLFMRDRAYLYNMAFILSAMLYQASISGFGSQYLWGQGSFLNDKGYGIGILATIFFAGRFAVRFIDLRNRLPALAKFTDITVSIFGLLLLPVVVLPENQILPVIYVMELLICLYAIGALLHQCMTGNYWARYLMAGWSVLITGTLFFVASQMGWIAHNVLIEYIHAAGLALGNVMVTSALAARMQRERSEKNKAMKKVLDLAQEVTELTREKEQIAASARDELDRRVDQKTRDLSIMLEQLKTSNEKLEHATLTDALTGVGNRRYLDNMFPEMIKQCQQTRTSLGVLVIDADHFKRINDEFGHIMGDECLKKIAVILQRFSRRNLDVLVRYGGEEFILLLPATDEGGVLKVAESIRHHIQYASFWCNDQRIPVTVSIGMHAGVPAAHVTAESLLVKADEALYQAKKNGRNRVELYRARYESANA